LATAKSPLAIKKLVASLQNKGFHNLETWQELKVNVVPTFQNKGFHNLYSANI